MTQMKIDCPCCGGEIDARHTEGLSTTLRRMYFVCEDCGYRTPAGSRSCSRYPRRPGRVKACRSKCGRHLCYAAQ